MNLQQLFSHEVGLDTVKSYFLLSGRQYIGTANVLSTLSVYILLCILSLISTETESLLCSLILSLKNEEVRLKPRIPLD